MALAVSARHLFNPIMPAIWGTRFLYLVSCRRKPQLASMATSLALTCTNCPLSNYMPTTMNKVNASKHFRNLLPRLQCLPALIAFFSRSELSSFALEQYELWPCGPCHEVKGHTSPIFDDIPNHAEQHTKSVINSNSLSTVNTNESEGCYGARLFSGPEMDKEGNVHMRKVIRVLAEVTTILYIRTAKCAPKGVHAPFVALSGTSFLCDATNPMPEA